MSNDVGMSETCSSKDLVSGVTFDDVLSSLLSTIRLSGSVQFCFMPSGNWQTDATPAMKTLASNNGSGAIPFHIVADGSC